MRSKLAIIVYVAVPAMAVLAGCAGQEPVPIDPANPPTDAELTDDLTEDLTDVTHQLEANDEMKAAAEQQCRDNTDLDVGYVRAVDPETDEVMAEYSISCDEVDGG